MSWLHYKMGDFIKQRDGIARFVPYLRGPKVAIIEIVECRDDAANDG